MSNRSVLCPGCQNTFEIDRFELNDSIIGCPECGQGFRVGNQIVRQVATKKKRDSSKDFAAFLMSLLLPGLGHIFKGKVEGLFWFACALVGGWFTLISGLPILLVGMLMLNVVIAMSAYNA